MAPELGALETFDRLLKEIPDRQTLERVTLLVPVLNEAQTIGPFLQTVLSRYPDLSIRIIDDGSTDQTKEHAMRIVQRYPNAELFYDDKRDFLTEPGLAHAISHGIRECQTPWYLCMDADGQHDPQVLDQMLRLTRSTDLTLVNSYRIGTQNYGFGRDRISRIGRSLFQSKRNPLTQRTFRLLETGGIIETDRFIDVSGLFGGSTVHAGPILEQVRTRLDHFTKPSIYLLRTQSGGLFELPFRIRPREGSHSKVSFRTMLGLARWYIQDRFG